MAQYYRSTIGSIKLDDFRIDYQSNPEETVSLDVDKYEDAIDNMDNARQKIDSALENVWEALKKMKKDEKSGKDFDADCESLMKNVRKVQDQIYKKYEKVTKDTDRAYKAVIKEMLKEWQAEKAKKAATENAANQELQ